ncbi:MULTISPECIES: hypothetical protein [Cyanophyceae]|uniref:hypothetical protein n=1 Tax=Cyanophyceae TaxID=3028117 RepID=UPI001683CD0F|nr:MULTISPECIES: hypothetical protein [Cyanophyceae]MBD1917876.1 hypothetical protein [Phormidium sp. FACHB-77]MBD2029716.1 hypothetical protein [Phormidium sp. FACHB-322]MBD2052533.1 hypothetical protein [Leptolyngbya sp. FACHB-60]
MTQDTLRLLQGFLGLLKLTDLVTSPPGLAVTLWLWLYLTLSYNSALTLWLIALLPLLELSRQEVNE